jgi:hypothetical protein
MFEVQPCVLLTALGFWHKQGFIPPALSVPRLFSCFSQLSTVLGRGLAGATMASAFCLDSGKTKNNATYRVTGGLLWFPNKIARFAKNANKKGINMHIHGKFR